MNTLPPAPPPSTPIVLIFYASDLLSGTVAISTCNYLNLETQFLIILVIFQVLNSHMWLVVTVLDNTDIEQFHH